MVMYLSNHRLSMHYCNILPIPYNRLKNSIASIVMLYHLSLLLHVHNYYVQLCLFYHMLHKSFVSHSYCIINAILTRIAITPYTQLYIIIICKYRGAYVYIIILYALSTNLYCMNSILHVLWVATRKQNNMSLLAGVICFLSAMLYIVILLYYQHN